ncbi:hypothetical protein CMI47_09360 [Candidatus Pacearchaeota archaeon]|nr:hypothetical protein [Candidatus Pacearchaeota archaeon]
MAKKRKTRKKPKAVAGAPHRHRTAKGKPILFARAPEERDDPEVWLRLAVAKNLDKIEDRIGTTILREHRTITAPLGCGAFGCVFRLADGRVLKVTSDEAEGPLSFWVLRMQRKRKVIKGHPIISMTAKMHDVFLFPKKVQLYGEWAPVYGIVREEVDDPEVDVPQLLLDAVDFYTDGWDSYCQAMEDGGRIIGAAIARQGLRKIRRAGRDGRAMAALLEYCWARGIPLMDVHGRNLATRLHGGRSKHHRRGQIVIFDFGGTEHCSMGPVVTAAAPGGKIRVKTAPTFRELAKDIPKL